MNFVRKALCHELVSIPFFFVFQDMSTVRVSGVRSLVPDTSKCGVCLLFVVLMLIFCLTISLLIFVPQ